MLKRTLVGATMKDLLHEGTGGGLCVFNFSLFKRLLPRVFCSLEILILIITLDYPICHQSFYDPDFLSDVWKAEWKWQPCLLKCDDVICGLPRMRILKYLVIVTGYHISSWYPETWNTTKNVWRKHLKLYVRDYRGSVVAVYRTSCIYQQPQSISYILNEIGLAFNNSQNSNNS